MLSRREFAGAIIATPIFAGTVALSQSVEEFDAVPTAELTPPGELDPNRLFGDSPPSQEQRRIARDILNGAPTGPRPIDIAKYFTEKVDPTYITQWPSPGPWNPLIVEFFKSTQLRASNDMVPWCAAFANWCLERARRRGSKSPASQSFVNTDIFELTDSPKIGDLVVWSFYREDTGQSTGLGHVAFVSSLPQKDRLIVLGGNQANNGTSSMICERPFPLQSKAFSRCTRRDGTGSCINRINGRLGLRSYINIA